MIRQELRASGTTANPDQATLTPERLAVAPIGAPLAVQQVIQAGNEIARLPYVWGGGHGTYADTGYDCSGSISYVFAAAHLLATTLVSGELATWGTPARASGSPSSPTPATRSCTWPVCASTLSPWPRPARAGPSVGRTNPT